MRRHAAGARYREAREVDAVSNVRSASVNLPAASLAWTPVIGRRPLNDPPSLLGVCDGILAIDVGMTRYAQPPRAAMEETPRMTPAEFARKWIGSTTTERAASQEHFIDLCRMLGVPTPNEADPTGEHYAFEKGVEKVGGGGGFADVWKRGHFAWEYKGKRKDLKAAYQQLLQYREALENPPLLVVCDLDRFEVHTNFTATRWSCMPSPCATCSTRPRSRCASCGRSCSTPRNCGRARPARS
jgi:hypothetical protein